MSKTELTEFQKKIKRNRGVATIRKEFSCNDLSITEDTAKYSPNTDRDTFEHLVNVTPLDKLSSRINKAIARYDELRTVYISERCEGFNFEKLKSLESSLKLYYNNIPLKEECEVRKNLIDFLTETRELEIELEKCASAYLEE